MDINHQKVVFKEGDPKIAQRFSQMGGLHGFHDGFSNDRMINLIMKISGGRLKSRKAAIIIGLISVSIMFIVSIIWFIEAFI